MNNMDTVYRVGRWIRESDYAELPFLTIVDHQINKFLCYFLDSFACWPGFYWVSEESDKVRDWGVIEVVNSREWLIHTDLFAPEPTAPLPYGIFPMTYENRNMLEPRPRRKRKF